MLIITNDNNNNIVKTMKRYRKETNSSNFHF